MNRRFFLKILVGMGVATSGIFGLKRCSMSQTVSNRIVDNLPLAIKIDEVGWEGFLQQWNDEITTLVKKRVLLYGLKFPLHLEQFKKNLKNKNIEFKDEIFWGGLNYPPLTASEKKNVTQRLAYIVDTISQYKKSLTKDEQARMGNYLIEEVLLNDGLLFPPADKSIIEKVEQRLQMTLPSSYKDFLEVSNGMLNVFGRLLPINEIDWLRVRDKETMETWWIEGDKPDSNIPNSEYLDYEALGVFGADEFTFRVEYLEKCLQIGDDNQVMNASLWLLNPVIQTAPNDWEGWVWNPGDPSIRRYRNFKEMMEISYRFDVASLRIKLLYIENHK